MAKQSVHYKSVITYIALHKESNHADIYYFSPPEQMLRVSYCDHLLSVVHRRRSAVVRRQ